MHHGVSAIYVLPAMLLVILVTRSTNRTLIWIGGVLIVLATGFFAVQGAVQDNNYGGLLAIAGFASAGLLTYLSRRAGKNNTKTKT